MLHFISDPSKGRFYLRVLAVLFVVALACGRDATAQWSGVVGESPSTGSPGSVIAVESPGTCSNSSSEIPNNAYLKTSSNFSLDTMVTNAGTCNNYLWGNYYSTSPYGVIEIFHYQYVPNDPTPLGPIRFWSSSYPNPYPLSYDSRYPTNGGTGTRTDQIGSTMGTYEFTFQSYNDTTFCGFTEFSPVVSKFINVVKCQPKWQLDSNSNIAKLPQPSYPDHVQVFLDPATLGGASTALDDAIDDWNSNVSGTGIVFERVSTSCGTGPACITVEAVSSLGSCGYGPPAYTDSNGFLIGSLSLEIDSSWSAWSAASLRRTFAHELGHRLGLADYDGNACDATGNSSIMQPNFVCSSTAAPTAALSVNDYLPINKTTYGTASRVTCGF